MEVLAFSRIVFSDTFAIKIFFLILISLLFFKVFLALFMFLHLAELIKIMFRMIWKALY